MMFFWCVSNNNTLIIIENIINETKVSLNTKIIRNGKIAPATIELNETYFDISRVIVKIIKEISADAG
jgi:hypothetical protein